MYNTTLAVLLVLVVLGFIAWLGGGRKWAFRTLLSALVLLVVGALGILLYSYWTDKSAEHRAQKLHECAVAKVADPKCEDLPKSKDLPMGGALCPAYAIADDATAQQQDEALAAAEKECRGETDPTLKSLHEQINQYRREHGIAENKISSVPWTEYQKGDWFEQNAAGKQTKITMKDCAARVRKAYPRVYDDLDDATLTKKVLAKYPDYCNAKFPDGFVPDIQGIR
jgi:hypothetical protein